MKIHKEGYPILLLEAFFTLLIGGCVFWMLGPCWASYVVTAIPLILLLFLISFFRFPERTPAGNEHLVSAPADGTVVIIKEVQEDEYFHCKMLQISIFMSFFNVHANWSPLSGVVNFFCYHRGRFVNAIDSKSSTNNERTSIVLRNSDGQEILCRQIAGLFARRVVSYAEYEKKFNAGDQIGFIKFGSRADVFLPLDSKVFVKVGDKVTGAETILADIRK